MNNDWQARLSELEKRRLELLDAIASGDESAQEKLEDVEGNIADVKMYMANEPLNNS